MSIEDLIRTLCVELEATRNELRRIGDDKSSRGTEYLTVRDAAELANLHPSTIREWIKARRLRAGENPIRIRRDDLDAAIRSTPRSSAAPSADEQAISILRRSTTRRR